MAVYLGKDKVAGISTSQSVENNNLKLPEVAPGVQQIVSINSDGTQQNLTLGESITIQDGVISAISQSSTPKLYQHNVRVYDGMNGIEIYFTLLNSSSISMTTIADVSSALSAAGYTSSNTGLMAHGINLKNTTGILFIECVFASSNNINYVLTQFTWSNNEDGTQALSRSEGASSVYNSSAMTQIKDTVVTLLS